MVYKIGMICQRCGGGDFVKGGRTMGRERQRYKCKGCGRRTTNVQKQEAPESVEFQSRLPKSGRYVITAAQNATPIHKGFLASLRHYCARHKATLIVIPYRYRNPTSQWTSNNESHEWWAKEIAADLYDGRFELNSKITVLADIKVQPTASQPLMGLESITHGSSGILGHPKVQMRTIATPHNRLPKIMMSTGAVTMPNYTDTKAGKKGEFHHTFGAAVIEVQGKKFHLRQINALKNGSFIDLDTAADPHGCRKAPRALALVMGDTHVDFVDPDVIEATFNGPNSIVSVLRPQQLVWHDLLDFYSRNHHHRFDPITNTAIFKAGKGSVRDEVSRAVDFVARYTPKGCKSVIIASNHNEALSRWIRETDWKTDPENAEFYLATALAMVESAKLGDAGAECIDPLRYWADGKIAAKFLSRGESYSIRGVEFAMHGDRGPNGSRGSIKAFSRIGVRSTIGHTHSPGIEEGCHQTGTSTRLGLTYAKDGPSSWLNSHSVLYANGKRSHIHIIDGRWKL